MFSGLPYKGLLKNRLPAVLLFLSIILVTVTACSDDKPARTKWKYGIIPYCFAGDFSADEKSLIRDAMNEWETNTGIHFVQDILYLENSYFIYKVDSPDLNVTVSTVGYSEGNNYLITGDISYSHILHELGHCMGLQHEHQRLDRDLFIFIYWNNLDKVYISQFTHTSSEIYPMEKYPYDHHSIMHYDEYSGTLNGGKTIDTFGHRENDDRGRISRYDSEKIRYIYRNDLESTHISGTDPENMNETTPGDDILTDKDEAIADNKHS